MSNGVGKVVVTIVAAAIGFAAAKYGWHKYQDHLAKQGADDKIAQLRAEAAKDSPNAPTSMGMQQAAIRDAANAVNSAADDQARRSAAASTFFGFYLINSRSRPEFCKEQGVDITAFTSPFESHHARLLEVSRPIMVSAGYDEEKLYGMLKPQLRSMLEQDMKDIATSAHTDAKGACELLASVGANVADKLQFDKMQPTVYHVLLPGG
ncbi:MAG TPA: hypothetical protein VF472_18630 [Burkholderiaceae bacterium]